MTAQSFSATIQSGHKEHAVEVPFDPRTTWGIPSVAIRPGRRGHPVTVDAVSARFDSFVVARSGRHWLILDDGALRAIAAQQGDVITLELAPRAPR